MLPVGSGNPHKGHWWKKEAFSTSLFSATRSLSCPPPESQTGTPQNEGDAPSHLRSGEQRSKEGGKNLFIFFLTLWLSWSIHKHLYWRDNIKEKLECLNPVVRNPVLVLFCWEMVGFSCSALYCFFVFFKYTLVLRRCLF